MHETSRSAVGQASTTTARLLSDLDDSYTQPQREGHPPRESGKGAEVINRQPAGILWCLHRAARGAS